MNYLEKLTDLVCQEKNIEKDLKELRFWCKLRYGSYIVDFLYHFNWEDFIHWKYWFEDWVLAMNRKIDEIIWNPLEFHHLMMYCENKKIKFDIKQFCWESEIFINTDRIVKLDVKKPLHQQSEEVLKNIFEALIN